MIVWEGDVREVIVPSLPTPVQAAFWAKDDLLLAREMLEDEPRAARLVRAFKNALAEAPPELRPQRLRVSGEDLASALREAGVTVPIDVTAELPAVARQAEALRGEAARLRTQSFQIAPDLLEIGYQAVFGRIPWDALDDLRADAPLARTLRDPIEPADTVGLPMLALSGRSREDAEAIARRIDQAAFGGVQIVWDRALGGDGLTTPWAYMLGFEGAALLLAPGPLPRDSVRRFEGDRRRLQGAHALMVTNGPSPDGELVALFESRTILGESGGGPLFGGELPDHLRSFDKERAREEFARAVARRGDGRREVRWVDVRPDAQAVLSDADGRALAGTVRSDQVWHVGASRYRILTDEGEPVLLAWLSAAERRVRAHRVLTGSGDGLAQEALNAFVDAALRPEAPDAAPCVPARVFAHDRGLARVLRAALGPLGVEVRHRDRLSELEEFFALGEARLREERPQAAVPDRVPLAPGYRLADLVAAGRCRHPAQMGDVAGVVPLEEIWWDMLEGAFRGATVIADEAADLYYQGAQTAPTWRSPEIPIVAPPFSPSFWVEMRRPGWATAVRPDHWIREHPPAWGALFTVAPLPAPEEIERMPEDLRETWTHTPAEQRVQIAVSSVTPWPTDLGGEALRALLAHAASTRWLIRVSEFAYDESDGFVVGPEVTSLVLVGERGELLHATTSVLTDLTDTADPLAERRRLAEERIHAALFAVALLHAKNSQYDRAELPRAVQRRFRAQFGRPTMRHHVLNVRPLKVRLMREGMPSGDAGVVREHLQRGHFKDYRDTGLFGKLREIYWWDAHVRGSPDKGSVHKRYRIRTEGDG